MCGVRVAHFCDSHAGRSDGVAISVATTVALLRGAGHEVQVYQPAPLLRGLAEPCGVRSVPVPLRNVRIGVPRFHGMRRVPAPTPESTPAPPPTRMRRRRVERVHLRPRRRFRGCSSRWL